jgi:superfamily II DNA or RNA helicase
MIVEQPKQQIMLLAHNRSLLKYIHDHIDFATKGYYIGGMKQDALQESESKQIIIATFSMASEALDIKTLTTLIMATPKTNIEQSVGRITRKIGEIRPIVYDIVDQIDWIKKQGAYRKKFYKKKGFEINNWEIMEDEMVELGTEMPESNEPVIIQSDKVYDCDFIDD